MRHDSTRKREIRELETIAVAEEMLEIVMGNDNQKTRTSLDAFYDNISAQNLLLLVSSQRYLSPRNSVPKSKEFLQVVLPVLDESRWRQEIRMSKEAFKTLAQHLSQHKVFFNKAFLSQRPVELQLMVALYRLGGDGGSSSVGKISRRFGVSEGAVELYTRRSLAAILSLEQQLVKWPSEQEKMKTKKRIFDKSGFPNCVGFVDGTLIVLDKRPTLGGSDYYSHKSRYGLAAQVVCDDQRKILNIFAGFCGSAHDNRVFRNSRLGISPKEFFKNGEFILADSGYCSTMNVVSSYKKRPLAPLEREKEIFNKILASTRVVNEHCIGMLKGRFQCLRGLRVVIRNKRHHKKAVYYIRACAVLHNFLLDDYYDLDWNEENEDGDNEAATFDVMNDEQNESRNG